jgi:hypothetical protein
LSFDSSILSATRLSELTLDTSLLSFKIVLLEGSRRDRVITNAKSFTIRIETRTGRLYIFLIIFNVASIRRRYNDSRAIDFVSKILSFITFYFLI